MNAHFETNYQQTPPAILFFHGSTGYRDDSLNTVKRNQEDYGMDLKILSYEDLYGWTMDKIVAQVMRETSIYFCFPVRFFKLPI